MLHYEDDCVDCPQGCVNCGLKHTPHYYCDECGEETDLYYFEGQELCINCIELCLEKVGN